MLNQEQRESIESILQGWDSPSGEFILPIVEGPPGTGKTTVGVLASARYREENRRPQIAYLCHTHYAADRALEAFIELGFSPNDVLRVVDRGRGLSYQNLPYSNYYIAYNDVNELTPQQQRVLRNTPILITTLHGSAKIFRQSNIDIQTRPLIIIDEFSQVPPTLFFSTVSKVRRFNPGPTGYVLLGDPNQLPVITTQQFLRPNVGIFIMSRRDYEPYQLNLQYRMHQDICQAVNALRTSLHTYPLQTHQSAQNRTLTSLGYSWDRSACPAEFTEILDHNNPLVIINTDNLRGEEEVSLGGSKYFISEARLATRIAEAFSSTYFDRNGQPLLPIILSPYSAQIGVIKSFLPQRLQNNCITIYQAQGREYPCVIISFARKNPYGWIGFLGEGGLGDVGMRAQTYVACSRAMAKLVVLFSFSTFRGHRDYDYLLEKPENALIVEAEPNWGDEND
jgi:superfamily I DNA and/or RNA helicase